MTDILSRLPEIRKIAQGTQSGLVTMKQAECIALLDHIEGLEKRADHAEASLKAIAAEPFISQGQALTLQGMARDAILTPAPGTEGEK